MWGEPEDHWCHIKDLNSTKFYEPEKNMIKTSDYYQCEPAEREYLLTTKLRVRNDTPSYIMAEDQERVFTDCKVN